jgi:hypothetical protein
MWLKYYNHRIRKQTANYVFSRVHGLWNKTQGCFNAEK